MFARVASGVVAETFTPPAGVEMTDCFAPGMGWTDCSGTAGVAPGWTYDGTTFAAPVPPPPPKPSTLIPPYSYFERFTPSETNAIHGAALASPSTPQSLALFNYLLLAAALPQVDLADPVMVGGHQMLVAAGLLTAARSAAILTP